jgi:glucose-6-phosphate isomerase
MAGRARALPAGQDCVMARSTQSWQMIGTSDMSDTDEAWRRVLAAGERLGAVTLAGQFAADPDRFARFSARHGDLLLDYSKERVDADAMTALVALAEASGVAARRDAMFAGHAINETEGRAVLHVALRGAADPGLTVDGRDVAAGVEAEKARFLAFAEDVRAGRWRGVGGAPFTDIVNIGIGGSDLGPAMATAALAPFHDGPRTHFVSNVDGAHLAGVTARLDPATTLVIVASKTFTTLETMTNAASARDWLAARLGDRAGDHLAAVSTNLAATAAFGIDDARVFGFWDWVGGRYSLWSAIGLPLAIAVGRERFAAMLAGAADIDRHFRTAPLAGNLPVLLGLIGVWRRNALALPTLAVIPYDQRLARFPAYLQQLAMESNGKSTALDGRPAAHATSPVVWGEPGTNAQHSFFQLLHQGSDIVPVDFLIAARPDREAGDHHLKLAANCFAQSQALAFGLTEAELRAAMRADGASPREIDRIAPHRAFAGNRPSTTILYRQLDPATLGRLIALYEHKVFVEGVIWDIDSFDQWGVELGKELAGRLLPALAAGAAPAGADASTLGLAAAFHALRK